MIAAEICKKYRSVFYELFIVEKVYLRVAAGICTAHHHYDGVYVPLYHCGRHVRLAFRQHQRAVLHQYRLSGGQHRAGTGDHAVNRQQRHRGAQDGRGQAGRGQADLYRRDFSERGHRSGPGGSGHAVRSSPVPHAGRQRRASGRLRHLPALAAGFRARAGCFRFCFRCIL